MSSQASTASRWDAIIIGAGLGGLTTAAYLAAQGRRVLVLERYSVLGGSTHVFRRRGRWEFEVGVHYMEDCGPGGMVPTVLAGLGLRDRVEFNQLDPDGFDTIVGPDLELRTPVGWDAYRDNLHAAFPTEGRAIGRYLRLAMASGPAADRMHPDFGSARRIAAAGVAAPAFLMPYAAVLMACGFSPRAIMTLCSQAGAYASTPDLAPFGMHTGYIGSGIEGGAWFPRGGGQVLSANLFEFAQAHGAEVRTSTTVDQILLENGRAQGVILDDGQVLRADIVVSDADILHTFRDLIGTDRLPKALALRTRTWKMGYPFINTYFGIEQDLRGARNTNHYVIPTWDRATTRRDLLRFSPDLLHRAHKRPRGEWLDDFTTNIPAFIHSGTIRDPDNPRTAPQGCASLEVMTLIPSNPRLWGIEGHDPERRDYRHEPVYRDLKERLTEAMLARIERVYPGASTQVAWSEAATPATQQRYVRNTNGAAFGLAVTPTQYGPTRPGVTTSIPGLLITGTSTRWGPGTTGAMLSGVHAAGAIVGRDLLEEVKGGAVFGEVARIPAHGQDWDPLAVARPRTMLDTAVGSDDEDADPVDLHRDSSRGSEETP
ncbi:NAD(P)/FAD-dependent oxidoreductase [Nocardioides sp.]|uniref:phytoene desaturase family protein n=1 Tax=Nocardioides sp. TaxID=35761 RepID=UPI002BCCCFC8|nr:NAD(P)/FAD-dependent oxidoreductase [Nocardioides sp.]HSX65910.1 NAD(P)/FAD-dependent oxidoreductase [Nocardioides sp.]